MTGQLDSLLIDQIVAEVLGKLRQRMANAPNRPLARISEQASTNGSSYESSLELHDAVITEAMIKLSHRREQTIRIAPKAILTPTARDYIRSQNISVIRSGKANGNATRSSAQSGKIIASHLPDSVQSLLADVRRNAQAVWSVETESGVLPVVERVRSIICRGEAPQAVVFAKNCQRVSCLVNRNPHCRATVVKGANDVRTARAEIGANVICVDLLQPTFIGLREILRASAKTMNQISEPDWGRIEA